MTPKVSIIVPVYNANNYLDTCLECLIRQTLNDIEIICIDDGSLDNSLEILNEYAKKDDRIIVISQKNQGPGVARNKGLEIAKGEFLGFLDPDDYVDLNFYEVLYQEAIKTNNDIVRSNICRFNNKMRKCGRFNSVWQGAIYKHDNVVKYNIKFNDRYYIEDVVFYKKLMFIAQKKSVAQIYTIDSVFYYYNIGNSNSLTHNAKSKQLFYDAISCYESLILFINDNFDQKNAVEIFNNEFEPNFMWLYEDTVEKNTKNNELQNAYFVEINNLLSKFKYINEVLNCKNSIYSKFLIKNKSKFLKNYKAYKELSLIEKIFSIQRPKNEIKINIMFFKIRIKK